MMVHPQGSSTTLSIFIIDHCVKLHKKGFRPPFRILPTVDGRNLGALSIGISMESLVNSDFRRTRMAGADIQRTNFAGTDFSYADFKDASMQDVFLTDMITTGGNFKGMRVLLPHDHDGMTPSFLEMMILGITITVRDH